MIPRGYSVIVAIAHIHEHEDDYADPQRSTRSVRRQPAVDVAYIPFDVGEHGADAPPGAPAERDERRRRPAADEALRVEAFRVGVVVFVLV